MANETRVEGQITQEVTRQKNLSAELLEVVDKLETRLADVTQDKSPPPEQSLGDKAVVVSLAQQISDNNEGVINCMHRLVSLTERIEI